MGGLVRKEPVRGRARQPQWSAHIEPTGKPVEVTAVNIDRVVEGCIVEHSGAANLLGPLLEIGAIQVAGSGRE